MMDKSWECSIYSHTYHINRYDIIYNYQVEHLQLQPFIRNQFVQDRDIIFVTVCARVETTRLWYSSKTTVNSQMSHAFSSSTVYLSHVKSQPKICLWCKQVLVPKTKCSSVVFIDGLYDVQFQHNPQWLASKFVLTIIDM